MKDKNKLVFISSVVFLIYLLAYILLAIFHFIFLQSGMNKWWFIASIILVLLTFAFIITMQKNPATNKILKLLDYAGYVLFIMYTIIFFVSLKYNDSKTIDALLIITCHIVMVLTFIYFGLKKIKTLSFTTLILLFILYVLYTLI
ncbi:hypothetical protein P6439_07555 [Staphylococcus arlettae]|nr:hypothetical protein [Staphylococcus arlettae]